jgi:hypothetical protein
VSTAEALMSAGLSDPYELYEYVHVSQVGNCSGSGMGMSVVFCFLLFLLPVLICFLAGGTQALRTIFRDRSMDKADQVTLRP